MQCCSCNVQSCKPSEHRLKHLDIASVEVVERVRLVVADAVEGARLPGGTLRLSKNLQPGQIRRGRDRLAPLDIGGLSDRQKFQYHTFYISDSVTFGSSLRNTTHLVSMQGILGVGEPSGGLVDTYQVMVRESASRLLSELRTKVMKSERSTRLLHQANIKPDAARDGKIIFVVPTFSVS